MSYASVFWLRAVLFFFYLFPSVLAIGLAPNVQRASIKCTPLCSHSCKSVRADLIFMRPLVVVLGPSRTLFHCSFYSTSHLFISHHQQQPITKRQTQTNTFWRKSNSHHNNKKKRTTHSPKPDRTTSVQDHHFFDSALGLSLIPTSACPPYHGPTTAHTHSHVKAHTTTANDVAFIRSCGDSSNNLLIPLSPGDSVRSWIATKTAPIGGSGPVFPCALFRHRYHHHHYYQEQRRITTARPTIPGPRPSASS
jgi:hypothetical protein